MQYNDKIMITNGTGVQTHRVALISSGNVHGKQREATGNNGKQQETTGSPIGIMEVLRYRPV